MDPSLANLHESGALAHAQPCIYLAGFNILSVIIKIKIKGEKRGARGECYV